MTTYDNILTPLFAFQSSFGKAPWRKLDRKLTAARDRALAWGMAFWLAAALVAALTKSDLAFVLVGCSLIPFWRAAKVNRRTVRIIDRIGARDQRRLRANFDAIRDHFRQVMLEEAMRRPMGTLEDLLGDDYEPVPDDVAHTLQ